jgi:integrase
LLVAALTGCSPSELERGIKVWQTQDAATQEIEIHFEVAGAKVKREQGQPHRRLTYAAGDTHPLLSMIKALLPGTAETPVVVQVASAMNFSSEVQRLAGCLWPSHPHTVTAYCLRHQWGADAKRNGDADAVSRGLGHLSRKTQRVYGTASQGKPAHRLKPLRIEAERPVKGTAPEVTPTDPDEPESAS